MSFFTWDFPREVLDIQASGAKGFRRLVANSSALERYWAGKNGLANAYMTVYGYRATRPPKHHRCDYNTPIIRHFVMDFDCKDFRTHKPVEMDVPLSQVRELHTFLMEADIKHAVWFSGGGFHVWVMLDESHMPMSGREVSRVKEAGRRVLSLWESKFGLTCSDPAVPFDTSGMIRIPNSYNDKKGLWSIPLTSKEIMECEPEQIMEIALNPRRGVFSYGEKGVELQIREVAPTPFKSSTPKLDIATAQMDGVKILPCLNAVACQEGNPDHFPRVYLAQFLLHRLRWFHPRTSQSPEERRKAVEKVVQFMGSLGWADWDEAVTTKHVQHIAEKYDEHPTCATLFSKGYCLGKCQYHDGTGIGHAAHIEGSVGGERSIISSSNGSSMVGGPVGTTSYPVALGTRLPLVEGGLRQ
tara:strand:+ start:2217 stop:3455 length:1239 start_codon:yes stop_codon:yes gene_type:complete